MKLRVHVSFFLLRTEVCIVSVSFFAAAAVFTSRAQRCFVIRMAVLVLFHHDPGIEHISVISGACREERAPPIFFYWHVDLYLAMAQCTPSQLRLCCVFFAVVGQTYGILPFETSNRLSLVNADSPTVHHRGGEATTYGTIHPRIIWGPHQCWRRRRHGQRGGCTTGAWP